jgi:hypothetical protein
MHLLSGAERIRKDYLMSTEINDLTVNYENEGVLVVKEIDKEILSRGAWATLIFKYQDWDARKSMYGPTKYTIRRYRKIDGVFRQQSKFNISSPDQAEKIIAVLQRWISSDQQS